MIAEQEEAGHELYPNMLKNREFANAEYHRFDSEKTGPLFAIGAVFLESKMRFSAKAKIDSSTCLGIHSIFLPSWRPWPLFAMSGRAQIQKL